MWSIYHAHPVYNTVLSIHFKKRLAIFMSPARMSLTFFYSVFNTVAGQKLCVLSCHRWAFFLSLGFPFLCEVASMHLPLSVSFISYTHLDFLLATGEKKSEFASMHLSLSVSFISYTHLDFLLATGEKKKVRTDLIDWLDLIQYSSPAHLPFRATQPRIYNKNIIQSIPSQPLIQGK